MEDRLVQYPNRVQLIQVEGQPGIYDIVPMPGTITSEGTPLNKLTLLSDSVAELLGSPATPSEALGRLAERIQPIELGGTGDDLSNVPTGAIITKSSSNKLTYWNAVPIKHGGTGADNVEDVLHNFGLSEIGNQLYVEENITPVIESYNKACELTLPKGGKWLILGFLNSSYGGTSLLIYNISGADITNTARGTMEYGGGLTNWTYCDTTQESKKVYINAYAMNVGGPYSMGCKLIAIRLK